MPQILALCGSLRAQSINRCLLQATTRIAQDALRVKLYPSLGDLPLFNPDLENPLPASVIHFQQQVAQADALLIASPEYAHGVTGCMKNALDWLVSFIPFAGKPVAVFNASPRAQHADAALKETLRTMAAQLVEPASITLPLLGAHLSENDIVHHPKLAPTILNALRALAEAAEAPQY